MAAAVGEGGRRGRERGEETARQGPSLQTTQGKKGLHYILRAARSQQQLPRLPRAARHATLRGPLRPIFLLT